MRRQMRLTGFLVLCLTYPAYSQVFVKLKAQFMNNRNEPRNTYIYIPVSLGLELEKKITVDKAISIGLSNRSYTYTTNVNWAGNNDFMAYVRDYTQDDFIDGWLADPEIKFQYLNVPVGFRIQSRLFFGLKYQAGFNFLLKKPVFHDNNFTVPIPLQGHSPVVIDHTITVFFTAFGFVDMFGCYTISAPLVQNKAYTYDFMKDFIARQNLISYGINFSLTKFKRKKI